VAQLPDDATMSIEVKIVRWPGAKQGRPSHMHWADFFLETWSCTIPGHKSKGWMATSKADVLLFCQCSFQEDLLDCFPLQFDKLRKWCRKNWDTLKRPPPVPNIIDGRELRTVGVLAPIRKVCRALKVEGFSVDEDGLVSDLLGEPLLRFLREPQ
jgi:hypothetical protein